MDFNSQDKKIKLSEDDIEMYGYNFDELGKVFEWEGKILRGIYPEKKAYVRELLECGLVSELIQKGLFPKTSLTNYELEGFDMILEHAKISPIIYPSAWSFDMIKDAGLCVLEVNKIAKKYGYQTIDSHGYNVLFNSSTPYFIDLGSFIKNDENPKGWIAYEEFIRYYLYPLKVFKSKNFFLGRAIIRQGSKHMPHSSFLQYKYHFFRLFSARTIDNFMSNYHKYKSASHFSRSEIEKRASSKAKSLLLFLKDKNLTPFQKVNLSKLERKIKRIKLPAEQTQWGYYHDQFLEKEGKITSTPRFNRIIEILNELKPESILEVGGNQGMFSEQILQDTDIQNITCTDYDEIAVNKMYNRIKARKLNITPSLLNVVAPLSISYGPSLAKRYESNMVIALALTHHLILTQKIPLKKIFEQFSKFTDKYLITEFMPMGLYSNDLKRKTTVPEWYTEDWFKAEFEKTYKILYQEKLEQNRILFVGEKLTD